MEKNIKKECIYVYKWVTLLYGRNEHIVNQLYFNLKKWDKKFQIILSYIGQSLSNFSRDTDPLVIFLKASADSLSHCVSKKTFVT